MSNEKEMFLTMIDTHKNRLINPVEMLNWTWLRVFISVIPDDEFQKYYELTERKCGQ